MFKFYDDDGDGYIGFVDFVHGMAVLSRGSQKEKLKYAFKGYDMDGDGFVSRDELLLMLRSYHTLSMELVRDVIKSCEEEMMASFDDSTNRPISTVFNAPIPEQVNSSASNQVQQKSTLHAAPSFSEDTTFDSFVLNNNTRKYTTQVAQTRRRFLSSATGERWPAVEAMTFDAINELVDTIMTTADQDKDGKLSEREFNEYALVDTNLIAWFESVGTVF